MKEDANVIPIRAEEPRKPTFDERRIILAELQDRYVDEKTGYAPGWSDEKIATSLNVPRAWVSDLREQNFGPVKDSAEVRAALEEAQGVLDKARSLHDALVAEAEKAEGRVRTLKAAAQRIETMLGSAVRKIADLERASR